MNTEHTFRAVAREHVQEYFAFDSEGASWEELQRHIIDTDDDVVALAKRVQKVNPKRGAGIVAMLRVSQGPDGWYVAVGEKTYGVDDIWKTKPSQVQVWQKARTTHTDLKNLIGFCDYIQFRR